MTGALVTDPATIAAVLQAMFATGISPRSMGLTVPAGHTITAADVVSVDRALIRLQAADEQPPMSA